MAQKCPLLAPIDGPALDGILEEIGTDLELLERDAQTIRLWMDAQRHLPKLDPFSGDNFLKSFLVSTKNSLERSKQKLDAYYTARRRMAQFFANRDPLEQSQRANINSNFVGVLRETTEDNCRVMFCSTVDPDPERFDYVATAKRFIAIIELRLRYEPITAGDIYVMDSLNFGPRHILKINPLLVAQSAKLVQEIFPTRLKKIIFINSPSVLEMAVNKFLRPFLSKKLNERVFVYSEGGSALEKHVPKRILPRDFGGDGPTLEQISHDWTAETIKRRDWFVGDGSKPADETKRWEKNGKDFSGDGAFSASTAR